MTDPGTQPVVLIIEDDPVSVRGLAGILDPEFQILIATRQDEALALISDAVDLVLLDLYLGDHDSFGLLAEIKATEAGRNMPVLCVTGSAQTADIEEAFSRGAIDYVVKPYNKTILLAKIRTFIDLKRKTQLLQAETFTDPLTGVGNRRLFQRQLELEWRRMMREQAPLGLVVLDVDHFKEINDRWGHRVGDATLRRVTAALKQHAGRASDLVARYGGDEFVLLLPGLDLAATTQFAEQLRQSICRRCEQCGAASENCVPLTATLGCAAMVPGAEVSAADLFDEADRQLYRAKEGGRNCVRPE